MLIGYGKRFRGHDYTESNEVARLRRNHGDNRATTSPVPDAVPARAVRSPAKVCATMPIPCGIARLPGGSSRQPRDKDVLLLPARPVVYLARAPVRALGKRAGARSAWS